MAYTRRLVAPPTSVPFLDPRRPRRALFLVSPRLDCFATGRLFSLSGLACCAGWSCSMEALGATQTALVKVGRYQSTRSLCAVVLATSGVPCLVCFAVPRSPESFVRFWRWCCCSWLGCHLGDWFLRSRPPSCHSVACMWCVQSPRRLYRRTKK